MSLRMQLATGTLMLLAPLVLMAYAVSSLYGMPYLCAATVLWLVLVEYAVVRAWWVDVCEIRSNRRARHARM